MRARPGQAGLRCRAVRCCVRGHSAAHRQRGKWLRPGPDPSTRLACSSGEDSERIALEARMSYPSRAFECFARSAVVAFIPMCEGGGVSTYPCSAKQQEMTLFLGLP
jgi:hypothetical protein